MLYRTVEIETSAEQAGRHEYKWIIFGLGLQRRLRGNSAIWFTRAEEREGLCQKPVIP